MQSISRVKEKVMKQNNGHFHKEKPIQTLFRDQFWGDSSEDKTADCWWWRI